MKSSRRASLPRGWRKWLAALSTSKRAIFLAIIILIATGGAVFLILGRPAAIPDQDRKQDLFKIETSVINNITSEGLPVDLASLHLSGLIGDIRDYKYRYDQRSTDGGPTLTFELCATFQTATFTAPVNEDTTQMSVGGYGAENYSIHRKGEQCYKNGYYKGGSHITPLYNKNEIKPTIQPANHIDLKQLVPKIEAQYKAQVAFFGGKSTDRDLLKKCKQSRFLSDTPTQVAYDCTVGTSKTISASYGASETKKVADQFVGLLKQQGYEHPFTTNGSSNAVEVEASDRYCRIDSGIWVSQVHYDFYCSIFTVPVVPEGLTLE